MRTLTLRTRKLRAPWVPQPNAANGTVIAGASTIANDGVASCSITVTVKDSTGAAIAGCAVSVAVTGTGNTVTQPSVTNSQGVAVGSFVSTTAEAKTLSATANGIAITQTASCTVTSSSGGTVATFTAVDRDTVSSAGGAKLTATVSGISGTPSNPTVNGVTASGLTIVDSTHISFLVPALSVGGPYDILLGGQTLAACVTVLPAPTTTYATADFEDGTMGGFTAHSFNGTCAVSTDQSYQGTKSAKCSVTGQVYPPGTGNAFPLFAFSGASSNPALFEANGIYLRYYLYIPSATLTNVNGTHFQIKTHLLRQTSGSGQPGWLMGGVGSDFNGNTLSIRRDNGVGIISGGETSFALGDGVWLEIQHWQHRDGASMGHASLWVNGKNQFKDYQSSLMGSDTLTDIYQAETGIAYTQPNGTVVAYIDHYTIANGYIDP